MMDDKLKKFYDGMVNDGHTLPDYERFKVLLSDETNLRKFYGGLPDLGYAVPEYDSFIERLGLKKKDESELSKSPSPEKGSGSRSYLELFQETIPQVFVSESTAIPIDRTLPRIEEAEEPRIKPTFKIPTLQDVIDRATSPQLYDILDQPESGVLATPSQMIEREIENLSKSSPDIGKRKDVITRIRELELKGSVITPDTITRIYTGDGLSKEERDEYNSLNKELKELNDKISEQEDRIRAEWRESHKEREELFLDTKEKEGEVVSKLEELTNLATNLRNEKESLETRQKAGVATEEEVDSFNARVEEFQKMADGYSGSLSELAKNLERTAFLDKKISHIDEDIRVNFTNDLREVGNSIMLGLLSSVEGVGGWLVHSGTGKEEDVNALGRKVIGEKLVEWSERIRKPYEEYIAPTQQALGDFDFSHFGDIRFWKTNAPMMVASSMPYMVTGHIGGIAGRLVAPRLIAGLGWGKKATQWGKFLIPGVIGSGLSSPVMAMSYGGQSFLKSREALMEQAGLTEPTEEIDLQAGKAAQRTFYEVLGQSLLTNTLQMSMMHGDLPWNKFLGMQNKFLVGSGRNAVIIGEQGLEEWFQEYRTYRNAMHYAGEDYLSFDEWMRTPEGKMVFTGGVLGGAFHAGISAGTRMATDVFTGKQANRAELLNYYRDLGTAHFAMTGDNLEVDIIINRLIKEGELKEGDKGWIMEGINALRNDPTFMEAGLSGYIGVELANIIGKENSLREDIAKLPEESSRRKSLEKQLEGVLEEKNKIGDAHATAKIDVILEGDRLFAYKDGESLAVSDMNAEERAFYNLVSDYHNKRSEKLAKDDIAYSINGKKYDTAEDFLSAIQEMQGKEELEGADIYTSDLATEKKAREIFAEKRKAEGLETETIGEVKPEVKPEPEVETEVKPEVEPELETEVKTEPKAEDRIGELELERDKKIMEASLPGVEMKFLTARELVMAKDPVAAKERQDAIKEKNKKLKDLIDCLKMA